MNHVTKKPEDHTDDNLFPRKPEGEFGIDDPQAKDMMPGTYSSSSKTYYYSKRVGEDGVPHEEKYSSHKVLGQNEEGERVGELNEKYHNTSNKEKRMANERVYNDQGRRILKTQSGTEPEKVNEYYKNLHGDELKDFEKKWEKGAKSLKQQDPTFNPIGDRFRENHNLELENNQSE